MAARQAAPGRRAGSANPTHFLCIPLLRRQLARSITAFRSDVCNINAAAPLPADAIRPPGTMHITLGVMSLPQPAKLDAALSLLRELRLRDVLAETRAALHARAGSLAGAAPQEGNVWLTLRGLRAMQDVSKTGVLYAPPVDAADGDSPGLLYAFCKAVRQKFIDAGCMEAEKRPFLMHATVVNTTHVKKEKGARSGKRERLMIDARALLDEYEEFVWLDSHEVRTVAICKMGAKETKDGDAAYEVVEEVTI